MFEIVSFESLKDLLDLQESSISDYPALQVIKLGVFAAFEEELGRSLEKGERTETYRAGTSPTRYIDLVGLPVVSVSEVIVNGDTTLTEDQYSISEGGIRLNYYVTEVEVEVTYIGGYETKPPAALERAALLQVSYEYQNKESIGASSVSTEGGTVTIPEIGLLKTVRKTLDKFKHPSRTA